MKPRLILICGCNGSGKTTIVRELLRLFSTSTGIVSGKRVHFLGKSSIVVGPYSEKQVFSGTDKMTTPEVFRVLNVLSKWGKKSVILEGQKLGHYGIPSIKKIAHKWKVMYIWLLVSPEVCNDRVASRERRPNPTKSGKLENQIVRIHKTFKSLPYDWKRYVMHNQSKLDRERILELVKELM